MDLRAEERPSVTTTLRPARGQYDASSAMGVTRVHSWLSEAFGLFVTTYLEVSQVARSGRFPLPFLLLTSAAILHGGEAESASTEAIAPAVTILGGGQHDGTTEVDRLQVGLARVHRPDRWAGGEGGRGRTIPFLLVDYGADLSYHIGGFGRSWSSGYDSFRWEAEDRGPTSQAARAEARPGSAVRVGEPSSGSARMGCTVPRGLRPGINMEFEEFRNWN